VLHFRLTYTAYLLHPLLINWTYQNQEVGAAFQADLHSLYLLHFLLVNWNYQNQEVGAAFQADLHSLPLHPLLINWAYQYCRYSRGLA
jgi:hypothetical protein